MHRTPFDQLINRRQTAQEQVSPSDSALSMRGFESFQPYQDIGADGYRAQKPLRKVQAPHLHLPELELVEFTASQSSKTIDFAPDRQLTKSNSLIENKYVDINSTIETSPKPAESLSPSAPRALFSPEGKLTQKLLQDGSVISQQAHPDGTVRTHHQRTDGSIQEKISDRYGRPFYECDIKEGTWTLSEMKYLDSPGKISPFLAWKKVTASDGTVTEYNYGAHGKASIQTNNTEISGKNTTTI